MLPRWRAVENTESEMPGPRFEPQTSCSRDERIVAQLTGRCSVRLLLHNYYDCVTNYQQ